MSEARDAPAPSRPRTAPATRKGTGPAPGADGGEGPRLPLLPHRGGPGGAARVWARGCPRGDSQSSLQVARTRGHSRPEQPRKTRVLHGVPEPSSALRLHRHPPQHAPRPVWPGQPGRRQQRVAGDSEPERGCPRLRWLRAPWQLGEGLSATRHPRHGSRGPRGQVALGDRPGSRDPEASSLPSHSGHLASAVPTLPSPARPLLFRVAPAQPLGLLLQPTSPPSLSCGPPTAPRQSLALPACGPSSCWGAPRGAGAAPHRVWSPGTRHSGVRPLYPQ